MEEVELREMKRPPTIAGGTVLSLELAAAFLYASRVLGDGGGLDKSSVIRTRGKITVDSRFVDDHGHSHLTMTSLRLRVVYPYRLRITNECDRAGACAQGLEAGEETVGE